MEPVDDIYLAGKDLVKPLEDSIVDMLGQKDYVDQPNHYMLFEDEEAIEVIASSMSHEAFYGYCFGNLLKYKLRCGEKDNVNQELRKAEKYKALYKEHKHLCRT